MFGWGRNTFGQLGLNDTRSRGLPCQLRTLRNIKVRYVTCGEDFSAFLTMVRTYDSNYFLSNAGGFPLNVFFQDGGVFTCGAGMYGQLGHGNNNNDILPRQVMELMGSTVTQVKNYTIYATCLYQHHINVSSTLL